MGIEDEESYKKNLPASDKQQLSSARDNVDQTNAAAELSIGNTFAELTKLTGVANATIDKGGYNSQEKDTYDVMMAYQEWQKAKQESRKCLDKMRAAANTAIINTNNKVNGVQSYDSTTVNRSYQELSTVKNKCKESNIKVRDAASKYIDTLKRVENNNEQRANSAVPVTSVEGFEVRQLFEEPILGLFSSNTRVIEGLDECDTSLPAGVARDSYVAACNRALRERKDLEKEFQVSYVETDNSIKLLNKLSPFGDSSAAFNKDLASRTDTLRDVADEQKKDVYTNQRKSLYEIQQVETLVSIENTVMFVYWALLIIIVIMFFREWFFTREINRKIVLYIILILIFPRVIIPLKNVFMDAYDKITSLLPTLAYTKL